MKYLANATVPTALTRLIAAAPIVAAVVYVVARLAAMVPTV